MSERMTDGRLAQLVAFASNPSLKPWISELAFELQAERAKVAKLEAERDEWVKDNVKLEAKVAELETENKALIHDLHAYMDTANAELNRAEKAEAKAAELEEQNRSLQNFLTLTSHSHDETVVTDLRLHIDRLEATIERVKALRPETVNVGFGSTFVIPLERLEVALEEISDE